MSRHQKRRYVQQVRLLCGSIRVAHVHTRTPKHDHPGWAPPAPRRIAPAYVQSELGRPPLEANMREGGTTLLSSTFGT